MALFTICDELLGKAGATTAEVCGPGSGTNRANQSFFIMDCIEAGWLRGRDVSGRGQAGWLASGRGRYYLQGVGVAAAPVASARQRRAVRVGQQHNHIHCTGAWVGRHAAAALPAAFRLHQVMRGLPLPPQHCINSPLLCPPAAHRRLR